MSAYHYFEESKWTVVEGVLIKGAILIDSYGKLYTVKHDSIFQIYKCDDLLGETSDSVCCVNENWYFVNSQYMIDKKCDNNKLEIEPIKSPIDDPIKTIIKTHVNEFLNFQISICNHVGLPTVDFSTKYVHCNWFTYESYLVIDGNTFIVGNIHSGDVYTIISVISANYTINILLANDLKGPQ